MQCVISLYGGYAQQVWMRIGSDTNPQLDNYYQSKSFLGVYSQGGE